MGELDGDVRLHLYRTFVARGKPPSVQETAEALEKPAEEIEAAYRRLAEGRVIVLEPGSTDIWMANPLSARPTSFRVETQGKLLYGTCAWDAPGVLAMLGSDGEVSTECPDCAESVTMEIRGGELQPLDAVAHFAVPARKWWEDIGFT